MKKLENIERTIKGNWFKPREELKNYKSVVQAEYIETTSSAGDWSGYFVQKIGNYYYYISFSQENNFPQSGFILHTGNVFAKSKEIIDNIINDYITLFYKLWKK